MRVWQCLFLFAGTLAVCRLAYAGVVVTNVAAQQQEGTKTIVVEYDVLAANQVLVGLEVRQGGGRIAASGWSGDVGLVGTGVLRRAVWNAGADWPTNVGVLTVHVAAEDGLPLYVPYEGWGPSAVPRSGLTNSYASGDDGDVRPGVPWPSPRFINNGDGTVTDMLTGLMWRGQSPSSGSWSSAVLAATNAYAGYGDWRLPNVRELQSVMSYYGSGSWPGGYPFASSGWFWSSTVCSTYSSSAYLVNSGGTTIVYDRSGNGGFLPVRGMTDGPVHIAATGQTNSYSSAALHEDGDLRLGCVWPSPRFTDHGNGTVTDHLTGLMWSKATQGPQTWLTALNSCNAQATGGYDDWRLPSVNDLRTLFDFGSKSIPALPAGHPFTIPSASGAYWTSTTYAANTAYAYWASFANGEIRVDNYSKMAGLYWLACRGGVEVLEEIVYPVAVAAMPETGQTESFAAGDDGDVRAGVAEPVPRFEDKSEEPPMFYHQVRDCRTDLYWYRDVGPGVALTWQNALVYASDATNGGLGDWRMPNIRELESLAIHGQSGPALTPGHPFSGLTNRYYWSSTTYPWDTGFAFCLDMETGRRTVLHKTEAAYLFLLRERGSSGSLAPVVQTGQTIAYAPDDDGHRQEGVEVLGQPRFADHGNGTVSDRLTGLVWLKDAGIAGRTNWLGAVALCAAMDFGGFTDWRLPNRLELDSLVDHSRTNSVLPEGHPFVHVQSLAGRAYWASTTVAGNSGYAACASFLNGLPNESDKGQHNYVWPVRGGK